MYVWKEFDDMCIRFDTTPECDGQTDGRTCRNNIALCMHHHHHIYFRLPERPQKPIELATIKQHKENCKNEKNTKK